MSFMKKIEKNVSFEEKKAMRFSESSYLFLFKHHITLLKINKIGEIN